MKEKRMSPAEALMLKRLDTKPKRNCMGCNKVGCTTCGVCEYESVTSASGRWVKHPDERCDHGYGI